LDAIIEIAIDKYTFLFFVILRIFIPHNITCNQRVCTLFMSSKIITEIKRNFAAA